VNRINVRRLHKPWQLKRPPGGLDLTGEEGCYASQNKKTEWSAILSSKKFKRKRRRAGA